MVARGLLETIRSVGDNTEDATTVLTAMVKLAEDPGLCTEHAVDEHSFLSFSSARDSGQDPPVSPCSGCSQSH